MFVCARIGAHVPTATPWGICCVPQITVIVTVTQRTQLRRRSKEAGEGEVELVCTHPALRTAPVQLKEDAAVPVAFALYGDAMTLSPSSSSDTAVVRLIRSSSEICKMQTLQSRID